MTPEIKFVLACFGMSLVITYAWWCLFRTLILRGRLFLIRDRLWDAMYAKGMVDDPAHIEMRNVINSLISAASTMNWLSFLFILVTNKDFQAIIGSEPKMPEIRKARRAVGLCIADYLLRMTLTGWILLMFALAFNFATDLKRSIAKVAGAMAGAKAFCPVST